ncbi:MAG: hypothetical protein AAGA60_27020 [Cyanobacteria bacterium P01_E01_bin.42]
MAEIKEMEKLEVFVELRITRSYTSYGDIYAIAQDLGLDKTNPHHINALKEAIENGKFTDKALDVEALVQKDLKKFCSEETMQIQIEELE